MSEGLKVEYVNVDELEAYGGNAKLHPAEQIEQIKTSIEEFGFNDPIAVWKDNVIIEGHGRLLAAKELEYNEVPIIRLDGLTDEQRRAYMLVHNKLTMNTTFDYGLLDIELEEIKEIDMEEFGFTDIDFSYLDEIDGYNEEDSEVEALYFSMSLTFEKQYENELKKFIKDNGKEGIVDAVIEYVMKGE